MKLYYAPHACSLAPHIVLRELDLPFELIRVAPAEDYAANCVRVNGHVLMASGFPLLESTLRQLGYAVIALDMSEFQKMDGGLSCLSLRF